MNIGSIKAPVAEALPCSEPGREYQRVSLQYLDNLAAAEACQAILDVANPNIGTVNAFLDCIRPVNAALIAAARRKAALASQVISSQCKVTADTQPAPPGGPPPTSPGPNLVSDLISRLFTVAQNIGVSPVATTSPSPTANGNTDPVDLFSGSFALKTIDLSTPGIIPVQLSRFYSSAFADRGGLFGKGTGTVPYGARVAVKTDANGVVIRAPGTELSFSLGDQTEVTFTDVAGNLEFTAPGKPGFPEDQIIVRIDSQGEMKDAELLQRDGDQFRFNKQGNLTKIEDRNGNTVRISRNASTQTITRIFDPSTDKGIKLTYNVEGFVATATGLDKQTVSYEYDENGRLTGVVDTLGQKVAYLYDAEGRLVTITDARGVVVLTNVYDQATGVVTSQTLGDGSIIGIDYADETTRRVTDGNGNTTEYHYDPSGLFTAITTALGQRYNVSYSPAIFDNSSGPRTVTRTDPEGRTGITHLNEFNQPIRIIDAAGNVSELSYEAQFQFLVSVRDPLGRITNFTRDGHGNIVAVTDAAGNQAVFRYNKRGQVVAATDPSLQTTRYKYNHAHNLVRSTDQLGNATLLRYDAFSQLTSITDAKGNRTRFTYDALNRLTGVTNALGQTRTFVYDPNENLVAETDARGNTTTAAYDAISQLTSITSPDNRTASFTYDPAGNLISTVDPKGQTTTYTYDALDQVTQVVYADGTVYAYTYDGLNRLSAIQDAAGKNFGFVYDLLDRIVQTSSPQGSLAYAYDAASQLLQLSSPDTPYPPISYTYDILGQLTGITQNVRTYQFSYDALGRRNTLTRPDGHVTTYAYDGASRLTTLTHQGPLSFQNHRYSYDRAGNILQYLRTDDANQLARSYKYDALNRLIQVDATGSTASGVTPESASWAFDENGNITSKTRTTANGTESRMMTYDAADRLVALTTGAGVTNLTYDANGNLIEDSTGRKFTWNALNQLTRLEVPGKVAAFTYDPLGRRTSFEGGGGPRSYLYSGIALLRNGESNFLHGAGIDEVLELTNPNASLSYLQDHLNSTTALVDQGTGNLATVYDYTSYGKLEGDLSNPQPVNPFTYTGREDDATGLYYYRNRYYDPSFEVFISEDPLGDGQGYVAGNPLLYADPLGLARTRGGVRQVLSSTFENTALLSGIPPVDGPSGPGDKRQKNEDQKRQRQTTEKEKKVRERGSYCPHPECRVYIPPDKEKCETCDINGRTNTVFYVPTSPVLQRTLEGTGQVVAGVVLLGGGAVIAVSGAGVAIGSGGVLSLPGVGAVVVGGTTGFAGIGLINLGRQTLTSP